MNTKEKEIKSHNSAGAGTLSDESIREQSDSLYKLHKRNLQYELSQKQSDEFWENGFIYLKNIFNKEDVEQWDLAANRVQQIEELINPNNLRAELTKEKNTNKDIAWKLDPFHDLDLTFNSLVNDRRILDKLASLYQGREPVLFKDKLIYKPPGGHGNDLHQDYIWWQGFPTSLISVMIAIDPGTTENGCTTLFPGYKKGLMIPKGEFGFINPEKVEMEKAILIESQPGDIAIFHCMTPHLAKSNNSNQCRRQFFLTYNDSKDGEHYQAHRRHYHWYTTRNKSEAEKQLLFFK